MHKVGTIVPNAFGGGGGGGPHPCYKFLVPQVKIDTKKQRSTEIRETQTVEKFKQKNGMKKRKRSTQRTETNKTNKQVRKIFF